MPKKLTPLILLVIFAAVGFLSWRNQERIANQRGDFEVRRLNDGETVEFYWSDTVEFPMARRLSEAFERERKSAGHVIIDLHSGGGSIAEGGDVIDVIERMKRTHLVTTRVGEESACLSMCVPIFLAGERRVASRRAVFMFHEPRMVDVFTEREAKASSFDERRASRKFVRDYFKTSPMDPAWLAGLEAEWKGKDIWKSGAQLVKERSNIVTELQ